MKPDPTSAVFPFQIVLVDLIEQDPELSALLIGSDGASRVYASSVPAGVKPALPYVVLVLPTETSRNTFDKWGNDGSIRADIWTDEQQSRNAQGLAIYSALKRLFQGRAIALGSQHVLVTCKVDLVIDMPDVDGQTHHTQVNIQPRTQQVA